MPTPQPNKRRRKPGGEGGSKWTYEATFGIAMKSGRKYTSTAAPYHTIPYHTIPYHTIPYHTIPYHTIPYHTIPYSTMPNWYFYKQELQTKIKVPQNFKCFNLKDFKLIVGVLRARDCS